MRGESPFGVPLCPHCSPSNCFAELQSTEAATLVPSKGWLISFTKVTQYYLRLKRSSENSYTFHCVDTLYLSTSRFHKEHTDYLVQIPRSLDECMEVRFYD